MKKFILIILFVSAVIYMNSCTSTTYEEISTAVPNPTYTANIEPVIRANCTGCHSGGQFPNLTTYEQVKESTLGGTLICRIDQSQSCGSVMPQSGAMSKQTIDKIILWKNQGCVK